MTDRTELERQIAELQAFLSRIADFPQKLRAPIEAGIAELQAQLAALDAEPERAEEEVLPCPFCGGKAVWREYDERYPFDAYGLIIDHAQDCFLSFHRCFDIGRKAWGERTALPLAPRAVMVKACPSRLPPTPCLPRAGKGGSDGRR